MNSCIDCHDLILITKETSCQRCNSTVCTKCINTQQNGYRRTIIIKYHYWSCGYCSDLDFADIDNSSQSKS